MIKRGNQAELLQSGARARSEWEGRTGRAGVVQVNLRHSWPE